MTKSTEPSWLMAETGVYFLQTSSPLMLAKKMTCCPIPRPNVQFWSGKPNL